MHHSLEGDDVSYIRIVRYYFSGQGKVEAHATVVHSLSALHVFGP